MDTIPTERQELLRTIAEKIAPGYAALRIAARTFDDIQHDRILVSNRVGSGTHPGGDPVLEALLEAEGRARKWIEAVYRTLVPDGVRCWQESTPGVSAYQLGRLLGEAGHPRFATPYRQVDNPDFDPDERQSAENEKRLAVPLDPFLRTVDQWRQRCGHGRPGRVPKGATQEDILGFGLPRAKVVVHLMMESCFRLNGTLDKNGRPRALSPYRTIIDEEKAKYTDRVHTGPCSGGWVSAGAKVVFAKCKVMNGKTRLRYAETGDPFQPGHVHAIGLRHAGKRMLEDLWNAAEEDWT